MNHKTYAEYKDSNVDWIGDIPLSWRLLKSKFIFSRINNQSTTGSEELLSVSEYYGVKPKKETIKEGEFISRSESLIGYKKCSKNDLVMNIMLAWKKGLGVTDYDGIVSPAYEIFNINTELSYPQYMNYLLRTDLFASEFKRHSYGVIDSRLRLYPDNFKEIECILPPLEEQKQIANYLDKKTSKIDTTIAKNKELIQLLEEKRTALINQVVTKGLNPEVPMKDSGIEWIGEIPEHWRVIKFTNIIKSITKGATPTSYGFDFEDDGINFVKIESISDDGHINLTKVSHISDECNNFLSRSKLKNNDILFAIAGATIGKVGLVTENILPANTNQALAIIRLNKNWALLKFIYYILNSKYIKNQLSILMVQSAQPNLSMESIKEFKVIIPSINEQKRIIEYLDKEIEKLNNAIDKIKENIGLLEEYKTSLIHHVVTGKIDVRGEEI